jgi:hypothetical protein
VHHFRFIMAEPCCICLLPLDDDIVVAMCYRDHYVHANCYSLVNVKCETCPICRTALRQAPGPDINAAAVAAEPDLGIEIDHVTDHDARFIVAEANIARANQQVLQQLRYYDAWIPHVDSHQISYLRAKAYNIELRILLYTLNNNLPARDLAYEDRETFRDKFR